MELALEEVSWPPVSGAFVNDNSSRRYPFGKVTDRSLSYLDINFFEQLSSERSRVFESVRKLRRPRQQINDALDFLDPSFTGVIRGNENSLDRERCHLGKCFVLPKVSIRPPKEIISRRERLDPQLLKLSEWKSYEFRNHKSLLSTVPCELISSSESVAGFKNKMYCWAESAFENYPKVTSHKSSIDGNGNSNLKANKRTECSKDFGDFYDDQEDIEAQINVSHGKDSGEKSGFNDKFNYQSTLKNRSRKDNSDVSNPKMRFSDIQENWRMRIMKEDEEKNFGEQLIIERRKSGTKSDMIENELWIKPVVRENPVVERERETRELPRSKSTPNMLEGIAGKKLEVWRPSEMHKRNESVVDVCVRSWEVYNDQQEADSLNDPSSLQEAVSSPEPTEDTKSRNSRLVSGKNFFGQFLNSRMPTPLEMFSNTEPFSQFWVSLSNIYGQSLVILMLALSLTEVMDNSVKLLSLQGMFLIYLYVGSIAVIICIYIWVLIDSCSSIQKSDNSGLVSPTVTSNIAQSRDAELQNLSTTKFGSLKKAHISRNRTSNTSFYLRIGAIVFGLGTLVFNGLEMAMHSMMESSCLNDVVFVHPILHGLFTFLQMHFLFVNSQVLVEKFGLAARFGFMHLAATNLALWIRLVIWESGNEWTYYVYLSQQGTGYSSRDIPTPLQLRGFPKFIVRRERATFDLVTNDNNFYQAISKDHISQVVSLHECLNTNSLGQLWTSSMPFLYPFIIQFSLIAGAVTYIMGQNVAKNRLFFKKQKKVGATDKNHLLPTVHSTINALSVDCGGASKGLFLGILCLVAGVVVIIIFLVVKENDDFPSETIFWLTFGMLLGILSITILMNIIGLVQIRKLSVTGTKMTALDKILSAVSGLGVQLFTILGIVVGASGVVGEFEESVTSPPQKRHGMLLVVSIVQLLQTILQSTFIVEGIQRTSQSRTQALTRPARQVVTFLIFSNAVLWVFDTFVIQSWMSQELQLRFFGVLAWGALSRIGIPLLVFFRFHSCVMLLEIWKKSYNSFCLNQGN